MRKKLQFKIVCWFCYCWKLSWIEYYLHQAQLVLSKETWARTLSSRTRTLFFSGLPVMWCKSVRLMHNWESHHNLLTGIEAQHLFPTIVYWLTPRLEQTIDYVIVQIPDPFSQSFMSRANWNNQKMWTMNTQKLSTLQVFQSFSFKCKNRFFRSCPKEFIRFLCDCVVNLRKINLQSIEGYHVIQFQNELRLLLVIRITWKQRRDVLESKKWVQLIKVKTLPVLSHFPWHGALFSRLCFCVQQNFENPVSYHAGTSRISSFTKSHVPNWFA